MTTAAPSNAEPRPEPGEAWRDRAARLFEELRGPCAGMVRRAYGSTLGDDEIEDVYSNAWMGTLRALDTRQSAMDDEEIRRYVFTSVAHQAGKEMRRRKRKPIAPLERAELVVDATAAPEERADQREQSRITRDLLSSLPKRRRAVLLLRYGWGLEPAQVCELIDGLSPRAYRKEITRGVDELTQKMKRLESGTWCEDREPVLKAFASGLADAEQRRQAEHHLSHCRSCGEFVGRLQGHLHDLGSSTVVPGALDLAADGSVDVPDRLGDLAERARESVASVVSRAGSSAAEASPAAVPGAAPRGAGAAGVGLLAKLAGAGAAGKAALACMGGGALAGVCVIAGVGPIGQPDREPARAASANERPEVRSRPFRDILPSEPTPEPPAENPDPPVSEEPPPPRPEPEPEPVPTEPPPPPAPVQQFGLPPSSSSSGTAAPSTDDRDAATAQEFGP
jgi:RNA polymerase sigma factor (sigma-70 family)